MTSDDKRLVNLDELGSELSKVPGMPEAIATQRAALEAAEFVERTRMAAGLTQAKLAEKLGVTQARVSQIEKGEGPYGASIALLSRIAAACGGTLHLAFTVDEAPAQQSSEERAATERADELSAVWED